MISNSNARMSGEALGQFTAGQILVLPLILALLFLSAYPSLALPTLPEVARHLTQPPATLRAKYIKFYPDRPSVPWEFVEFHFQTNGYLFRRHAITGTERDPDWVGETEREITARVNELIWTFSPKDNAVVYYDPNALGFSVENNNPVMESHNLALLEINNILNLGITYADKGGISVNGNNFEGLNRRDGHKIFGKFLTGESADVNGIHLRLLLVDARFPEPREFRWEIEYYGENVSGELPAYPKKMQYFHAPVNGERKALEQVKFIELARAGTLRLEEFLPEVVLGTNFNYFYSVQSDGTLLYTNSLGIVAYKASKGKLDNFFEVQKWIRRLFPVIALMIAGVAFFLYRRGNKHQINK